MKSNEILKMRVFFLKGEERFHSSHPRVQEKSNNQRAIPKYPIYEEPWQAFDESYAVIWEN